MRILLSILLCAAIACQSTKMSAEERARILDIHIETAGAYLSMGDYGRAVDQALRGLEVEPEHFKLRLYLARGLQKTGRTSDVLRAEQVFRSMPRDEDYRVALGLAETVERLGIAKSDAAKEVRTGQRYTQATDVAARADQLESEAQAAWQESIELYQDALTLVPGDAEVLNGLVRAHTLLGHYEFAISWGERVIEVTQSDRAWWTEALKRPGMSQQEEAASRRSLVRLDRLESSVHMNSYTLLAATNSLDAALTHLERAAELDPTNHTTHSRRAELLIDLGRHAEALIAIESFISRTDQDFESADVRRAFRLRTACREAIASQ